MGRLQEAKDRLGQAIALGREIRLDVHELVQLYHWLGGVMFWQGRYEDKIRIGEEGLALLGDDTRSLEAALMYQSIASGHWMTQNWEGFRDHASRMAQFIHDLPYVPELRPAHLSVIDLYRFFEKDLEKASRWRQVLEQKAAQHHDLTALGDAHMYAARICAAQGDLSAAIPRYQQALELLTRAGDIKEGCGAQSELGDRYLDLGDIETAEACFCASLAAAQKLENPELTALSYRDAGRALLCRRDWKKAADAFQQARRIWHELDSPSEEMWVTFLQGKMFLAQGNRQEARRHFQEAGALFAPGKLQQAPADLAYVLSALEEASTEPAEFRAFCRRMQQETKDGEPGEPASPTLVQWFLEPNNVHTVDQPPLHRDAFADPLSTGWVWRDPFGDCSFKVGDGLQIHAANGRHLGRFNLSAPRMVRPAHGKWVVQTICGPVPGPVHAEQKPDIGGLLIWVDEQNYLCLVKGAHGKREIGFWGCLEGRDVVIGRGRMVPGGPAGGQSDRALDHGMSAHLRLERVQERVRALCSIDGVHWFTVGSLGFPIADPVQLGVVAIGSIDRTVYCGAHPDGTAIRFESFDLWSVLTSERAD
jgi:tetratricopeptide (TPR) repeat protein